MKFPEALITGRLLRRYKRFLADVVLADGREVTVYCPNTGGLLGCCEPDSRVWLSRADNPRRKYPLTWEIVEIPGQVMVGINTQRANALVREALEAGRIELLRGYPEIRAEVPFPGLPGRVDFRLRGPSGDYFLEVKNVTAAVTAGCALFPDAVSERASRHARALAQLREAGHGAGLLFCAQREDVQSLRPADEIDPVYGQELRAAAAAGVELMAWRSTVSARGIRLSAPVTVEL